MADAPSTINPVGVDPLQAYRSQIARLESARPGDTVVPTNLEVALWNVRTEVVAARPVSERLALLREKMKQRERQLLRHTDRPRGPTAQAASTSHDGPPVERLDSARARVAAIEERKAVVAQRSQETEARIAELQGEIARVGGVAPRGLDAILEGTTEPDEAALRARAETVAVLQGKVRQLEQDLGVLQQEATRLNNATRTAAADVAAAELACLRVLEATFQEYFHAEAALFVESAVFPLRAVVNAIRERGETSPLEAVLGGLRIVAYDPNAPATNPTKVWMETAFFPRVDALPPELQAANAEPAYSIVARLIEDLRGSAVDA